jgi:hypothetical protein
MAIDDVPISRAIRFEKDHASVKDTYDVSVPVSGPALLADFQISVDDADLISGFLPGQTACSGARVSIQAGRFRDDGKSTNQLKLN